MGSLPSKTVLNFMQCFGKFEKNGLLAPYEGWGTVLWRMLDSPLLLKHFFVGIRQCSFYNSLNSAKYYLCLVGSVVTSLSHIYIQEAAGSNDLFYNLSLNSVKTFRKKECIPIGCVPPALYRMGEGSLSRTETP